eukprot:g4620.t1
MQPCPICGRQFTAGRIAAHVENCLREQQRGHLSRPGRTPDGSGMGSEALPFKTGGITKLDSLYQRQVEGQLDMDDFQELLSVSEGRGFLKSVLEEWDSDAEPVDSPDPSRSGRTSNAIENAGIEECTLDVDSTTNGDTALILAARSGHVEVVKWLLNKDADPNLQNEHGEAPLEAAVGFKEGKVAEDMAHMLLASGALVRLTPGTQILHVAAREGNAQALRLLVNTVIEENSDMHPLDVLSIRDASSCTTPFELAMCGVTEGHLEMQTWIQNLSGIGNSRVTLNPQWEGVAEGNGGVMARRVMLVGSFGNCKFDSWNAKTVNKNDGRNETSAELDGYEYEDDVDLDEVALTSDIKKDTDEPMGAAASSNALPETYQSLSPLECESFQLSICHEFSRIMELQETAIWPVYSYLAKYDWDLAKAAQVLSAGPGKALIPMVFQTRNTATVLKEIGSEAITCPHHSCRNIVDTGALTIAMQILQDNKEEGKAESPDKEFKLMGEKETEEALKLERFTVYLKRFNYAEGEEKRVKTLHDALEKALLQVNGDTIPQKPLTRKAKKEKKMKWRRRASHRLLPLTHSTLGRSVDGQLGQQMSELVRHFERMDNDIDGHQTTHGLIRTAPLTQGTRILSAMSSSMRRICDGETNRAAQLLTNIFETNTGIATDISADATLLVNTIQADGYVVSGATSPTCTDYEYSLALSIETQEDGSDGVSEGAESSLLEAVSLMDAGEHEIVLEESGEHIRAASIRALVVLSTHSHKSDMNVRSVLLLTYRKFMTPWQLLQKMIHRFLVPIPASVDRSSHAGVHFQKMHMAPIQIKVLGFFKLWLEDHTYDFIGNHALVNGLKQFLDYIDIFPECTGPWSSKPSRHLLNILKRLPSTFVLRHSLSDPQASQFANAEPPPSILPPGGIGSGSFLPRRGDTMDTACLLNPKEVARQFSIVDHAIFCAIRVPECMHKAWTKPDRRTTEAPNIWKMIQRFEETVEWVTTQIVKQARMADRIFVLEWTIDVATEMLLLNNFHGAYAFFTALNGAPVKRLKQSRQRVHPKKSQCLEDLHRTFRPDQSCQSMRQAMSTARSPCIPHLGIFLGDLTVLDEFDMMIGDKINFRKCRRIAGIIERLLEYQEDGYVFREAKAHKKSVLNLVKKSGLESLAAEVGLVKNGEIASSVPVAKASAPSGEGSIEEGASGRKRTAGALSGAKASTAEGSRPKKRIQREDGMTGRGSKTSKGLRHFSNKVCQKVKSKGKTTYNEVADELVREFAAKVLNNTVDQTYDEKNIRRRVYDALNVLMAMDIITKEKKQISWKGLPSNVDHDLESLRRERKYLEATIQKKRGHLQELLLQQIAFKRLVSRNAKANGSNKDDTGASPDADRVELPFILVSTDQDTVVFKNIESTKDSVFLDFSAPFQIHDDTEVLKQLNLHKAPREELISLIPSELVEFLPEENGGATAK